MPGGVQTFLCKGVQLVPREDDVIAVHQQVFRLDLPLFRIEIRALPLLHRAECRQRIPLDGAVGALEDLQQLGILFQRGAVGHGPALRGGGCLLFRAGGLAPAAVHVHMVAHLIPRHHEPGTMGTEHRIRRIVEVVFRLIAHRFDDLRRVVAGAVAVQRQAQLSPAPGVAHHLHGVAAHGSNRRKTGEDGRFLPAFRRVKTALHALDIAHGTADVLGGHFQPESIPRL